MISKTTTPRLFISYSSQNQHDVDELAQFLQNRGADIWIDHLKLPPGTPNYQQAIDAGIQQATQVIYVASPAANSSSYVHAELQLAAYYQKPVIPYWLDGDAWVKCAPMEMSRAQFIDARKEKRPAAQERLAQSLGLPHQPIAGPAVAATPLPPPVVAPPRSVPDQSFVPTRLQQLEFQGQVVNGIRIITPPVITIPAGPFLMGSDKRKDPQARDGELPQHTVTLGTYGIAQFPLTVAEYACAVGQTVQGQRIAEPSNWQGQLAHLDHPVVYISWVDAQRYADWVAQVTGDAWRLPSEAEWEKAARGDDGRVYPYGNTYDVGKGNTYEGGKGTTTPVGSYPNGASPYGVLDCSGNVWEWTSSIYLPYPYSNDLKHENRNDNTLRRTLRDGSWDNYSFRARAAIRIGVDPDDFFNYGGVRLVRGSGSI